MKNIYFKIAMLMTSLAFSNETVSEPKKETFPKTPFVEYHNRMVVFNLSHVEYERTKPGAIYVGVDVWATPVLAGKRAYNYVSEAEFRMGYNLFYNGREHITPFAAIGLFYDAKKLYKNHGGPKYHQSFVLYGAVGGLYDHEFNSIFNLGLNLKGLIGGSAEVFLRREVSWKAPVLGCEVDVPFTFRFGRNRHWDYRLEPFDIYIHGQNRAANYFGIRSALAYRF